MATKDIKKDPTEYSVEEKLQSLYQLQTMLTEIDKIKTLRGELPLEVQDLEDEIAGLTTRIEKASADVVEMTKGVAENKNTIEVSKAAIAKYQEQQDHVSNNREFDSLNKEIEFKNLEVELAEKRIREFTSAINAKKEDIEANKALVEEKKQDLEIKKSELQEIIEENRQEEERLRESARLLSSTSSPVCSSHSSVSATTPATVWVLFMYSVSHAAVASTRFRHSVSSISACARKSSFASTADAS